MQLLATIKRVNKKTTSVKRKSLFEQAKTKRMDCEIQ